MEKSQLKSRDVRDNVFAVQKSELMFKIREARMSQITMQQKRNFLKEFLADPNLLVGKDILHRVREEGSDEVNWEQGKVMSLIKIAKNVKRSEYCVLYASEPDNVWKFPLLMDFEKGDLILL